MIGYPILKLEGRDRDVTKYLRNLEGAMIDGLRRKGAPNLDLIPEGRGYGGRLVVAAVEGEMDLRSLAPPGQRSLSGFRGAPAQGRLRHGPDGRRYQRQRWVHCG